jgi:hypothetical protein
MMKYLLGLVAMSVVVLPVAAMAPRPAVIDLATQSDRPYVCDDGYVAGFVTATGFKDSAVLREGEMFAANGGYVVSNAASFPVGKQSLQAALLPAKLYNGAAESVPNADASALAMELRTKGQLRNDAAALHLAAQVMVQFERWKPCLSFGAYQALRAKAETAKRARDDAWSLWRTAQFQYERATQLAGGTR